MIDTYDLSRFLTAQAACLTDVERELRDGRKRTHWMWFVFPQLRGLGSSAMAQHYGIASLDEARAYLSHPILGPRLVAHTRLVLKLGTPMHEVFGAPDDVKLRSCLTLFDALNTDEAAFREMLDKHFAGKRDERTLQLLDAQRTAVPRTAT